MIPLLARTQEKRSEVRDLKGIQRKKDTGAVAFLFLYNTLVGVPADAFADVFAALADSFDRTFEWTPSEKDASPETDPSQGKLSSAKQNQSLGWESAANPVTQSEAPDAPKISNSISGYI